MSEIKQKFIETVCNKIESGEVRYIFHKVTERELGLDQEYAIQLENDFWLTVRCLSSQLSIGYTYHTTLNQADDYEYSPLDLASDESFKIYFACEKFVSQTERIASARALQRGKLTMNTYLRSIEKEGKS